MPTIQPKFVDTILKLSLYATMQSLYEKDKMFALQYIAAEGGYKITVDEEKCSQDAVRRRQQKNSLRQTCILWTPDKQEHFEGSVSEELRPRSKRRKWIYRDNEEVEGSNTPPSN